MLKVNPIRITANGNILAIYEYANPTEAEDQAKTISPDGNRVGMNFVSWISEPHFYKSGRIIIQYVGDNSKLISDLKKIMGSPFASMN